MDEPVSATERLTHKAYRLVAGASELFRGFCRRISQKNESTRLDVHAFTSGKDDAFIHLVFYEGGDMRITSRHYRFTRFDWENLYLSMKEHDA